MPWSSKELNDIVEADDLHISPLRADGKTFGTPTWIWCVEVKGVLYVRAYNGVGSRWYQSAVKQKAGRIVAAGETWDVTFETVSGDINDKIDDAYRKKYKNSQYLSPMISNRTREATILIKPAIK
ncbi:DUF2255 family protein [Salmonella enterica]|uniref:DUF2255 family protein n=1 Tax=Salmonella enterica TaxID=28901 RepID=A0A8E6QJ78_SALER|nr:DUF2255 family protein [Salmonella enterica]EBP3896972.1 DUF2255 family protein [Salmonella enterica subsp. enterica]EDS8587762.1 DUF2255 family protein [Salmonella enterica subsp. enterica serovar Inverness]EDU6025842.1 DUF2255 family protein [Salmonella enterica subsp. enterica serovar Brazil]EKB3222623.1 DUF2255 family protein [Salmonella enterica subsp. enterica serovar Gaminara]EKV6447001.1 DUF2255 family protein [Klebsiella oxytoca]